MRLSDFKLLTDECIHRDVVRFLRDHGMDVLDVNEQNIGGASDVDVIRRAVAEDRVVITHDRDFGTLAILAGEPVVGIVYLRPGHISPSYTTETIDAIFTANIELASPFILVAQRRDGQVSMRVRHL